MSELKFVDELPEIKRKNRVNTKWRRIGDQLRTHLGKWALVTSCKSGNEAATVAAYINRGHRYNLGDGKFDAVSRTTDDGRHVVYARFLGYEEEQA